MFLEPYAIIHTMNDATHQVRNLMLLQNGAGLENILPSAAATMRKYYANAITSSLEFLQMHVPSLRIGF